MGLIELNDRSPGKTSGSEKQRNPFFLQMKSAWDDWDETIQWDNKLPKCTFLSVLRPFK